MSVLPESYTILQYCGVWPSSNYSSGWKQKLYDSYTLLVGIVLTTIGLSCGIQLVIFTHNVDEFVDNAFLQLTIAASWMKFIVMIVNRRNIRQLLESVQIKLCQANNEEEKNILHKWDPQSGIFLQAFRWFTLGAVILKLITTIKYDIPSKTLLFNGWFPYDHTSSIGYSIAVLHQVIACVLYASIGSTVDSVICSIMMQTCAQLNILKCRLCQIPEMIEHDMPLLNNNSINNNGDAIDQYYQMVNMKKWDSKIIQSCLEHHLLIVELAETWNFIFTNVIFYQFLASGLIICVSAQILTSLKFMSVEYVSMIAYFGCVFSQIFIYCWYGNEVILESSDIYMAIYEMNWIKLPLYIQNDLKIMMVRSLHPIQFTSGSMIILSVQSFNSLIKTSYSIYNVLSQAS